MKTKCNGCGLALEFVEGITDPYQCSTAACWAVYNQVMEKEFSGPEYFDVHHLNVDAYMSQHPSNISRSSVQSVWIHLVALYLSLEKQMPSSFISRVMAKITSTRTTFEWLTPPSPDVYKITVMDLVRTDGPAAHKETARKWAHDVWVNWKEHHEKIIQLANKILNEMK